MQDVQQGRQPTGAAPELGRGPEIHHTREGDEIAVNSTRARQAVTGHNVRYVLVFGVIGVVVLFAIAYMVVSGIL
jgi:hypothetical protein